MFYDVLQQLCDKINLVAFNKAKMEKDKHYRRVLRALGVGGGDNLELDLIFNKDGQTGVDFEKAIRNMGRLNPKVKLITNLQDQFAHVHDQYAIYVDTDETIKISMEERKNMEKEDLRAMNALGQRAIDDMNLYTTRHAFAIDVIKKHMRLRRERMQKQNNDLVPQK